VDSLAFQNFGNPQTNKENFLMTLQINEGRVKVLKYYRDLLDNWKSPYQQRKFFDNFVKSKEFEPLDAEV